MVWLNCGEIDDVSLLVIAMSEGEGKPYLSCDRLAEQPPRTARTDGPVVDLVGVGPHEVCEGDVRWAKGKLRDRRTT